MPVWKDCKPQRFFYARERVSLDRWIFRVQLFIRGVHLRLKFMLSRLHQRGFYVQLCTNDLLTNNQK
jgi:hypothetical protein